MRRRRAFAFGTALALLSLTIPSVDAATLGKEDLKVKTAKTGIIEAQPVQPGHFRESIEVTITPAPEPVELELPDAVGPAEGETGILPPDGATYNLNDLMTMGVINWGGYRFTYYSQSVLPGGGLAIPGRHVNEAGFVSDGDGYIVLANDAPKGTVFPTPFGYEGKVYDRGTAGNHLDVYTR